MRPRVGTTICGRRRHCRWKPLHVAVFLSLSASCQIPPNIAQNLSIQITPCDTTLLGRCSSSSESHRYMSPGTNLDGRGNAGTTRYRVLRTARCEYTCCTVFRRCMEDALHMPRTLRPVDRIILCSSIPLQEVTRTACRQVSTNYDCIYSL